MVPSDWKSENTNMYGNFESLDKENSVLKIKWEDAEGLKEVLLEKKRREKKRKKKVLVF